MEQVLLTIEEAARVMSLSRRAVYRMLARGELRSIVAGKGARRIPASEIKRYVSERLEDSPTPQ